MPKHTYTAIGNHDNCMTNFMKDNSVKEVKHQKTIRGLKRLGIGERFNKALSTRCCMMYMRSGELINYSFSSA